jgi:hypothetical protein
MINIFRFKVGQDILIADYIGKRLVFLTKRGSIPLGKFRFVDNYFD